MRNSLGSIHKCTNIIGAEMDNQFSTVASDADRSAEIFFDCLIKKILETPQ